MQDGNEGPEEHIHGAFKHESNCGYLYVMRFKPWVDFLQTMSFIVKPSENSFSQSKEEYVKKNWDAHHADPDNEIRSTVASLIKWVEEWRAFRESKYFLDEPLSLKKIEVCQIEDLFVECKYICWKPDFKETSQGYQLQTVYHAP